MKVCILSMQRVNNYGSLLQAYSLKKIIEDLGHDVEFIDIKRGENEELNLQCCQLALNCDEVKHNWLTKQMLRVKNKFSNLEMKEIFGRFQSEKLGIKDSSNKKKYDVCVIGSDEVFNCLQKSKWGFDPQLFGDVRNASKVITYAACCGSTKVEMLSSDLQQAISTALSNLKGISVRDENTRDFVQNLSGKQCIFNLDPVAVGNFSEEIENVSLENKLPRRYCIVYAYKDRISDKKTIDAIINYCERYHLVPIAPFGKQKWIKETKALTPFELLKAFANAECVVTDTFHGTLFGAKYSKKLAIIVRDSNRNKLVDLTKRLGIENHVLTDVGLLESVLDNDLDRQAIDIVLKSARAEAYKYLSDNI